MEAAEIFWKRGTVARTPSSLIPGFSHLSTKIHTITTTERNPIIPSQVRRLYDRGKFDRLVPLPALENGRALVTVVLFT